MTRVHLLVAAFAAATPTVLAAPAVAGGYISAGMGSGAGIGGELGERFTGEQLDAGRLAVGRRLGMWALEASLASSDLQGRPGVVPMSGPGAARYASWSLGASLKIHLGLLGPIEGYVRGGVHRTWITAVAGASASEEMAGNGVAVGGGLQLPIRLIPGMQVAVWADFDRRMLSLSGSGPDTTEGSADVLAVGVSVGTEL